ncbi:MAG: hypothetical protein K2P94_16980 [Rhodospirillaceae bacterium]|nr:hypothetical protein [Rhodospirillaceae bacterium]
MSFKTKRTLNASPDVASEIELVMVSHDDNLVFEDNNMAPLEQLEYFERFAQTRLALQEAVPNTAPAKTQTYEKAGIAIAAFIHEGSRRYVP